MGLSSMKMGLCRSIAGNDKNRATLSGCVIPHLVEFSYIETTEYKPELSMMNFRLLGQCLTSQVPSGKLYNIAIENGHL